MFAWCMGGDVGLASEFNNGVPFAPIVAELYEKSSKQARERWGDPCDTHGTDPFFAWLNAPSAAWIAEPQPTHLAAYVFEARFQASPQWPESLVDQTIRFLRTARSELLLDPVFIQPVRRQFIRWANRPAEQDPSNDAVPIVTTLGAYLYDNDAHVRTLFPDLFGEHRIDFSEWFMNNVITDEAFGRDVVLPVLLSWASATS
jgi:hypothetical protein